jgi:hypothetical protein
MIDKNVKMREALLDKIAAIFIPQGKPSYKSYPVEHQMLCFIENERRSSYTKDGPRSHITER